MKTLLTITALLFLFNSYSQDEDSRIVVSKGDTLEMTKELRKEYTFMETVSGELFKTEDGTKYLIIWNVAKKSKHYVLKKEPQETKTYFEEQNPKVESVNDSKSIMTIKPNEYLDVAGMHLEKAGQYKNAAIVTNILTAGAGVAFIMLSDSQEGQIAGYAVIGVGQLTSLILNVSGNSNIKKAGEIFRKEKLKL